MVIFPFDIQLTFSDMNKYIVYILIPLQPKFLMETGDNHSPEGFFPFSFWLFYYFM